MRRILLLQILLLLIPQFVHAQLSTKDKRQVERAYNEGVTRMLGKNYAEAISAFNRVLLIDPSYAMAYLNRGRNQAALGDMTAALEDIEIAIEKDRDLAEAYFYMGYFMFAGDTTGMSQEYLQISLDRGFVTPQAYYYLGLAEYQKGNEDKALMHFNKAIALKDDYALAYHDRAGIKRNIGDYTGALYDYKASVNYKENFPLAYNNMASLKMILGDFEGAVKDYTTAIKQDPTLYLAYNNRGYAYFQMGDLEKAETDFEQAIALRSGFMEAIQNNAAIYARNMDYQTALGIMDKVISENPDAGVLYVNRGLIREMNGNVIGACEDWQKALDLGEDQVAEYLKECNN